MDVHEIRVAADAQAGFGHHREQLIHRRSDRAAGTRHLSRRKARRNWSDEKRGVGICDEGHHDQCGMSRHHRYADGCRDDRERPSSDGRHHEHATHWSAGKSGGSSVGGSLAVQSRRGIRRWTRLGCRWRLYGAVMRIKQNAYS